MKKKLLAVILTMAVSCQSLPVYAGEAADIFSDSGTEMSESGESTDDFSDGEPEKDVETAEETPQTVPELISPEEEPVENIFTDDQNENDSSDENQVSAYSTDTELTYGNYKYTVSGRLLVAIARPNRHRCTEQHGPSPESMLFQFVFPPFYALKRGVVNTTPLFGCITVLDGNTRSSHSRHNYSRSRRNGVFSYKFHWPRSQPELPKRLLQQSQLQRS